MAFERIAFVAGPMPEAQAGLRRLVHKYGNSDVAHADVVVALGGDGFMLQTLHRMIGTTVPIYGMNRGTVGFLMNDYEETDLLERINGAEPAQIHPLQMVATDDVGIDHGAIAINEVSLLRETRQTAKIRIIIDGKTRMEELICDGILVATPAGSTAYNLSAHGPVLPIDSRLLAITPISAFRPRRWRGALIDHRSEVVFEVLESAKRPVSAVADHVEVRNVVRVKVAEAAEITITMLFDHGHSLKERILTEQFFH